MYVKKNVLMLQVLQTTQMKLYLLLILDNFATVGNFTKAVNTENLASGIYFLKIFVDRKYTVAKVVVN